MAGYIGNVPVPEATQTRESFTATSGQTSFATMGYSPNYLDVYLNGVHLDPVADYTATNGTDIVLTSGAVAGDTLIVVAWTVFRPTLAVQVDEVQTLTNKTIDDVTNDIGANHVHLKVRNETGSTITKGTMVKPTGWALGHECIIISPLSTTGDVAIGMVEVDIPNNTNAAITNTGVVSEMVTDTYSVGDMLYSIGNGSLTTTKPTSGDYQTIGYVLRSHSSHGLIFVEFTEPNGINLPDQTGHSGKFLTTDGTTASWEEVLIQIDGGFANSTYLTAQAVNGGTASG